MTKRYYAGLVSATPPTGFKGMFDTTDALQKQQAGTWPVAVTPNEMLVPVGTTQLLGLKFNTGTLTRTGSYTVTAVGTLTYATTGGILDTGYASGWALGSTYLTVDNLNTTASMLDKTYVAWYKGTQTAIGGSYSPSVPIFGDASNAVYWGIGLSSGKICVANGGLVTGQTSVNTGQWFCLAWTVSATGYTDAYVNGTKEITAILVNTTYPGTRYIGSGYAYAGVEAPTAIDAIQIFDGILSASQIKTIYDSGSV